VTLPLPTAPRAGSRVATTAAVTALAACLLVVLGGAVWHWTGGSWAVIETPSMGRAAPVGTLVLIRERPLAQLHVGDVVTYRPRNARDTLYTHRVVAKLADGSLQVQGDINGTADPFPVTQADLVGKVVARWIGVGWLVRALPTMLLTSVVLLVTTGLYAPVRWRSAVRVLGHCLVLAVTSLLLRPFVHPILIAVTDDGTGPRASVVSGGLLPVRVTGADGDHVDLLAGQTGVVRVAAEQAGGALSVNGSPALDGWWLVGAVAVCLLPLLWCVAVGLVREDVGDQ
jgi:signal peptidase I